MNRPSPPDLRIPRALFLDVDGTLEFVAAQDPSDPGVLILSPLAGAARELAGAIQVNPHDSRGLAHAMQAALSMPLAERRERHAGMMEMIRRNDVTAWQRRFIEALKSVGSPNRDRLQHVANG